jgi:hypothetical protein
MCHSLGSTIVLPLLVPSNLFFHAEDSEEYEDYIEEEDDVIVEDDYTKEELDYMSSIVVRGLIFILIALKCLILAVLWSVY